MARVKRRWCTFLIYFFSALVFHVQVDSAQAKMEYVEQYLESVEVCTNLGTGIFSDIAKKKIRLSNFPNNTVVVKMTRWNEMWASFLNFRCKFQIVAPKKSGVMVVIQSMHLRSRSLVTCRDYVKFEQDDGLKTSQICGDIESSDSSKSPHGMIGPRYFYDPKGQMDVLFSTDDRDSGEQKPLQIEMVFTAYSECSNSPMQASQKMHQCSALRSYSCIPSVLTCDSKINCAFNDADFASDEDNCSGNPSDIKRSSQDTERSISIYVFAITSIATLLIVVFFVLIICCCLRRVQKRQAASQMNAQQLPLEYHITGPATAPPQTMERPEKSEDLPPSYNEIFGSHQHHHQEVKIHQKK